MFWPHAGGGHILYYRGLARLLGEDQPFFGLQARGLDGRKAPFERVENMATHYVAEIRKRQPKGSYLLGGPCVGGLIAYEMAQILRTEGEEVALLALLDTPRPRPGK